MRVGSQLELRRIDSMGEKILRRHRADIRGRVRHVVIYSPSGDADTANVFIDVIQSQLYLDTVWL